MAKKRTQTKEIIIGLLVVIIIILAALLAISPTKPWETTTEKLDIGFAYQDGFHYGQQIIMDHFDLVEFYDVFVHRSLTRYICVYQK